MSAFSRRQVLKIGAGASLLAGLPALPAFAASAARPKVVVIGAGFGGATAAKYLRVFGGDTLEVTLIERGRAFISCPLSNLVLGGSRQISELTRGYEGLGKHGVRVVQGEVTALDTKARTVRTAAGDTFAYDRLILSPGIDFNYDKLPGLQSEAARKAVRHGWKAGEETLALRKQLEDMKDGGVYLLAVPEAPFRCPPGPYERACLVANYFKQHKPRAKVIVADANADIVSKPALFKAAFNDLYKGIIEYRAATELEDVDAKTLTAKFSFGNERGDVLNVLPPMRASRIAEQAGLVNINGRWCGVNWLTTESAVAKDVYVIGDATQSSPLMPKSGHMANQHGKLAAASVLSSLKGEPPNPHPIVNNTCYSFVDDKTVIHVASVHQFDEKEKTLKIVQSKETTTDDKGVTKPVWSASGVSKERSVLEGVYGWAWAQNIWADMLG